MDPSHKPLGPRKQPVQARSKQKVEWVLEGAARVFRKEGFDATTNRIAEAAGVGIGTLYEYFPNKEALLVALAERHVIEAERGVDAALRDASSLRALLGGLQAAILSSQRYPSQAVDLIADLGVFSALRARVQTMRRRILASLLDRAAASGRPDPEIRARTAFGLIGELSSRSAYEIPDEPQLSAYTQHLLELAIAQLES